MIGEALTNVTESCWLYSKPPTVQAACTDFAKMQYVIYSMPT